MYCDRSCVIRGIVGPVTLLFDVKTLTPTIQIFTTRSLSRHLSRVVESAHYSLDVVAKVAYKVS